MPLFTCPDCGSQVSTRTESCPKCGCPLDSLIPDTGGLSQALGGTVWVYRWRGREFAFSFGAGGDIGLLASWAEVHWRVIGPTVAILDAPGGGQMVLRFDDTFRAFETTDWDGEPATGNRVS